MEAARARASVAAPAAASPEGAAALAAPVAAPVAAPAKPKPPAELPTDSSKVRLDDEQRKRLVALRAKYGGTVADKAAARAQGAGS